MSTTIDDKLRLFHKAIFDKLEDRKQEALKKFEEEKEVILKEKMEELDRVRKAYEKDAVKKAKLKANEIISKEELKRHNEILKIKSELIQETLEQVKKKLIDFADSEDYSNYFKENLNNALRTLKPGSYILYAKEQDLKRFQQYINEINSSNSHIDFKTAASSENIIGGFMLEDASMKFKYDNTLISKLTDSKEQIGIMVTEALA